MQNDRELLDRIARCAPEVRDWAESEGYENLKQRIDSASAISNQAATTLTILLAGFGGSLAYAVKLAEAAPTPLAKGAAAVCVYLAILAALCVGRCINLAEAPSLRNEPRNLLLPGSGLAELKAGELLNLQERIDQQKRLVVSRAKWLNAVRLLALVTPLIFGVGAHL